MAGICGGWRCAYRIVESSYPRAVIGDMDSVGALDQVDPAIALIHQTGQDDTDFENV